MSQVAIHVEGIGKRYAIGERAYAPLLRDAIASAAKAPARVLRGGGRRGGNGHSLREREHIWALKNISFDIREGEVLGLIGRNGAGKTTLLKIFARITRPTVGSAEVHGRMGSLLEVGTGFHYELTGRENCYLSGAILGMSRREINRRFDEIVAFAEVEKFIDTPIKHYSTGMQMRLAFAIAAHLEPEILLVDEVLAVGDTAFQKKCLGKMENVAHTGRTIILVSHSMDAIARLCGRALLLSHGELVSVGKTDEVISAHLKEQSRIQPRFEVDSNISALRDRTAFLLSGEICQAGGLLSAKGELTGVLFSKPWSVKLRYRVTNPVSNIFAGIRISDARERFVLNTGECFTKELRLERQPGDYEATCHIPQGLILPGEYSLDIGLDIVNGPCIQGLQDVARWRIINDDEVLGRLEDGRLVGAIGATITPWTVSRI
jgi:lipopolysaccharide transport system ATP-binding protein